MNCFLNFHNVENGATWIPNTRAELEIVIRNYAEIVGLFEYFPTCQLFYGESEMRKFIAEIDDLRTHNLLEIDEISHYEITQLINLIISGAIDWEAQQKHSKLHDYFVLLEAGYRTRSVSSSSIGECSEYKLSSEHGILINIFGCLEFATNLSLVDILKRQFESPNEIKLIRMEVLKNKSEIISYFLLNSKRKFNLNDKHGENKQTVVKLSNNRVASPLRCSKEEAAAFLKRAIGWNGASELYYFDTKYKEFIEFKDENTEEKSYHAYYPHKQNEIPKKVKDFILKNYEIIENIFSENTSHYIRD